MKIQIASDLHLENWLSRNPKWLEQLLERMKTDAEVLVLAGDIVSAAPSLLERSLEQLKRFAIQYENVVLCPGNHEFYGTGIDRGTIALFELEQQVEGLHVLVPGRVLQIGKQRFLGGTGWHPTSGPTVENAARITDTKCISDWRYEGGKHYAIITRFLKELVAPGDIVVTHHAPSWGSLSPEWAGHPANRFFITHEFEDIMKANQPAYWIHGHVHTPFRYKVGTTEVIANPNGYPGEGVAFSPQLTIEVP